MSNFKDLLNMKVDNLTGKNNTTDLIQLSDQMDKEQMLALEILQKLDSRKAAAELEEIEKALCEIDDYIKKGGK